MKIEEIAILCRRVGENKKKKINFQKGHDGIKNKNIDKYKQNDKVVKNKSNSTSTPEKF